MVKEHIDTTGGTVSIDGTAIDGITPGSLPFPKPKRDTKDVTKISDTVRRKGLKILDPGSASFSGMKIAGDAGQIALKAASNDMQEHTIQIYIPEEGTYYEYNAFVSTDYPSEEDENSLFFNVDLECTGGFVESTTFAAITSIEGAAVGVAYSPANANSALADTDNEVIFKETTGIGTDSVKVTAAAATYLGISYNNGSTWTALTSGTASNVPTANWPAAGKLTSALVMVQEALKATRFVRVFFARA